MFFAAVEKMNHIGTFSEVTEDAFKATFVTTYAENFTDRDPADFGEDYHDSDEVLVVGSFEDKISDMGWKTPEELVQSIIRSSGSKTVRA